MYPPTQDASFVCKKYSTFRFDACI